MQKKSTIIDVTIFTLLAFIVFYDSLDIYFLSDNVSHIENAMKNLLDLNFYYFRPVAIFSLALDQFIWGMAPFGFHLSNLLIHLSVTFLVYFLAGMILYDRLFQWTSALFFLLHPIHAIPVFWISGRTDMICAFFYLAAIIAFIQHQRAENRRWLFGGLLSFLFALLTKEMAVSLPFILIAWQLIFQENMFKKRLMNGLKAALPYFSALALYFLFRFIFIADGGFSNKDHQFTGILALVKNFVAYIGLMIIPGGHIGIAAFLKANPLVFMITAIGSVLIFILSFNHIRKSKPLLFFVLFVLITLLPVLRLLMRWYLYIPSIGFCLAVAWLVWKLNTNVKLRFGKISPAIVLSGLIALLYLFFLLPEQTRWKTAGETARAFTGKLAEKIADNQLKKCLMLNMDGEMEEAQVLVYGLEKFIHFRLAADENYHDSVQVIPVSYISWQQQSDRQALRVEKTDSLTYTLSLENSASFFIFPNHSEIYVKQNQVQTGTKISEPQFDIIITKVNNRKEAVALTISIKDMDIPVIYYAGDEMSLVNFSTTEY